MPSSVSSCEPTGLRGHGRGCCRHAGSTPRRLLGGSGGSFCAAPGAASAEAPPASCLGSDPQLPAGAHRHQAPAASSIARAAPLPFAQLDLDTGKLLWRFETTPGGDWKGVAVWGSMPPIDKARNAIYISTGEAHPSWSCARGPFTSAFVQPGLRAPPPPPQHRFAAPWRPFAHWMADRPRPAARCASAAGDNYARPQVVEDCLLALGNLTQANIAQQLKCEVRAIERRHMAAGPTRGPACGPAPGATSASTRDPTHRVPLPQRRRPPQAERESAPAAAKEPGASRAACMPGALPPLAAVGPLPPTGRDQVEAY